jgi:hypothetical protein
VAQAIADEIRINVTPQEQARLARGRPIDPEAQDSYLHGMLGLDADDCKSAIEYFNQALDQESQLCAGACCTWPIAMAGWVNPGDGL